MRAEDLEKPGTDNAMKILAGILAAALTVSLIAVGLWQWEPRATDYYPKRVYICNPCQRVGFAEVGEYFPLLCSCGRAFERQPDP